MTDSDNLTPEAINALRHEFVVGEDSSGNDITGWLSTLVWNTRNNYLMWPDSTFSAKQVRMLVEGFMAEIERLKKAEKALASWEPTTATPCPNSDGDEDSIASRRLLWWSENYADSGGGGTLAQQLKSCAYVVTKRLEKAEKALGSAYRCLLLFDAGEHLAHDCVSIKRCADALKVETEPTPERCRFEFPLPSWMSPDQDDPCRCDLLEGHKGDHSCEHLKPYQVEA